MSSQENKEIAKKSQKILEGLGHKIPLGHVYEFFSKLSGYNDHNVAKAKKAEFKGILPRAEVAKDSHGRVNLLEEFAVSAARMEHNREVVLKMLRDKIENWFETCSDFVDLSGDALTTILASPMIDELQTIAINADAEYEPDPEDDFDPDLMDTNPKDDIDPEELRIDLESLSLRNDPEWNKTIQNFDLSLRESPKIDLESLRLHPDFKKGV